MSENIAYYYNKNTGLYARRTKKNEKRFAADFCFNWKHIEKLIPRHQTKLMVISLGEARTKIPGVGSWRISLVHKEMLCFFLHNESWKKDFTYYPD